MKKKKDDGWKRGAIIPSPGKTKITIRIDDDILLWFRKQIEKAARGSYQTAMNKALREYVESKGGHAEDMMRRVIREELATFFVKRVDREQPGRKERGS
jgi:BrnA antitoxin of type II toxin-antitoxin system